MTLFVREPARDGRGISAKDRLVAAGGTEPPLPTVNVHPAVIPVALTLPPRAALPACVAPSSRYHNLHRRDVRQALRRQPVVGLPED